ncbi:MAG: hypothetical protein HC817_04915 [Saprospiraceae bacterium]|nr:hypothetical protein [Saprospiraceae bacterium]
MPHFPTNIHPFEQQVENAVKDLKAEKTLILDIKNSSFLPSNTEGSRPLQSFFQK